MELKMRSQLVKTFIMQKQKNTFEQLFSLPP